MLKNLSALLALLAIFLLVSVIHAQNGATQNSAPAVASVTPDAPAADTKAPAVPSHVHDKLVLTQLQLLATKRALVEANYKNVINDAQRLQADFEKITNDYNVQVDALYTKLGIKQGEYRIDLETGEISAMAKPKQE